MQPKTIKTKTMVVAPLRVTLFMNFVKQSLEIIAHRALVLVTFYYLKLLMKKSMPTTYIDRLGPKQYSCHNVTVKELQQHGLAAATPTTNFKTTQLLLQMQVTVKFKDKDAEFHIIIYRCRISYNQIQMQKFIKCKNTIKN